MTALIGGDPLEVTSFFGALSAPGPRLELQCGGAFVEPAVPVRLDGEAGEVAPTAAGAATDSPSQEMRDRSEGGTVSPGKSVEGRGMSDLVHRSPMAASDKRRRRAQCHQPQAELAE